MHRVGEKRKLAIAHDSSPPNTKTSYHSVPHPPPQKKVCTRNEPRISTFTGFFQGFFRYCAQKLSGMFHPQSLANHPDHQSSQEDSYSHSSINSTQEDSLRDNFASQVAATSTPRDGGFSPPSPSNIQTSRHSEVLPIKGLPVPEKVKRDVLPYPQCPSTTSTKSLFTPRLEDIGPSCSRGFYTSSPSVFQSIRRLPPTPRSKQASAKLSSHTLSREQIALPNSAPSLPDVLEPSSVSKAKPLYTTDSALLTKGLDISYWTQWRKNFMQDYKHLKEEQQVVVEIARTKLQLQQKERLAMEDIRMTRLQSALAHSHLDVDETPSWSLSSEKMERVQAVISRGNELECLSERYRIRISRGDLRTLTGLVWLNDEVINFYFNLISEYCSDDSFKVHVFNSFFYTKLSQSGFSGVRRWTKKVDIFKHDLILLPIHLGMHWCLAAIDFRSQQLLYYDSLLGTNPVCLSRLRDYLRSESQDKRKVDYDLSMWTDYTPKDIPQQRNSSDCGVFTCMYARHKARQSSFNFSQDDMPDIRNLMIYEILEQRLLL